jgi:hypothetical protein
MNELDALEAVLVSRLDDSIGPRLDLVGCVAVPVDANDAIVGIDIYRRS